VVWDEAYFVANSKSFCFEKEWNVTTKFTEIDKTIVATNNVVAMIPRMDFIKSGEMRALKLFLYSLGKASWDVRTRDSWIPFCIEERKFKELEDVCSFFVQFVYYNFQSMDLWNWKESWDEEIGFGLEECEEIVFEDNVFPAGENCVVISIEVIGLYTICKCPIV
jgi:hypothetical protein